ncbi:glucosaminidase domain-containing protein [Aliiglaciecola sp. CAU 1673]|uniref:glucosaminidase domain-containing protein n=1 Tax=Aliiglaciecola sp. CAU 1673 TaxID=3032595 RepID=UPI0023DC816C|nr:glucosaminidase domain-containing protein [Aliiglaciecola sp. CAU 1673]MDF2179860.1 glucosaminidase domain-containing protein [Aliiglaciecola sp. CAU 1673]
MPNSPLRQLLRALFLVLVMAAFLYPFLKSEEEIINLPEPVEISVRMPDFSAIEDIEEKKQAFFAYLRPAVEYHNQLILKERSLLQAIRQKLIVGEPLPRLYRRKLEQLSRKYELEKPPTDVEGISRLMRRVDIVPMELVLAQAANESAWGTSRFATDGYNFFGMWCYKRGCGFVPTARRSGASHEVAKFRDLSHAVSAYMQNINSHYAYSELRAIRASLRRNQQPIIAERLVDGLMSYSERGQDYIDELLQMIRINKKYMTS